MKKIGKLSAALAISAATVFVTSCSQTPKACLQPVDYKSFASCKTKIHPCSGNSCCGNVCKARHCKGDECYYQ